MYAAVSAFYTLYVKILKHVTNAFVEMNYVSFARYSAFCYHLCVVDIVYAYNDISTKATFISWELFIY